MHETPTCCFEAQSSRGSLLGGGSQERRLVWRRKKNKGQKLIKQGIRNYRGKRTLVSPSQPLSIPGLDRGAGGTTTADTGKGQQPVNGRLAGGLAPPPARERQRKHVRLCPGCRSSFPPGQDTADGSGLLDAFGHHMSPLQVFFFNSQNYPIWMKNGIKRAVIALKHVHKLFDALPITRESLIPLPLHVAVRVACSQSTEQAMSDPV